MPIKPTDSLQDIAQGGGGEPPKIQAKPVTPTPYPGFFLVPNTEATLENLKGTKAWAAAAGWQPPEAVRRMFGIKADTEHRISDEKIK